MYVKDEIACTTRRQCLQSFERKKIENDIKICCILRTLKYGGHLTTCAISCVNDRSEMKTIFKTNRVKRHDDTQTHDLPKSIFSNI